MVQIPVLENHTFVKLYELSEKKIVVFYFLFFGIKPYVSDMRNIEIITFGFDFIINIEVKKIFNLNFKKKFNAQANVGKFF